MCGRCRNVFNAFESLKRIEDNEESSEAVPTEIGETAVHAPEPPVFLPPYIGNLDDFATEAPPEFTATDDNEFLAGAADSGELVPALATPPDADMTATTEETAAITPQPTSGRTEEAPAFLLADPPPEAGGNDDAAELNGVADNPLLRTSYRSDPRARRAIWIVGIVMLLVLMAAQAAYFFRATVMEIYPQTRPYLVKACELAGCVISWSRDDAAIKIEASDLIESPAKPGRILLTATLVNRSKVKQELPAIELRLTDNNNQVLSSRIMQPRDYLGRAPSPDEGLAPNAELFVNLNFEIANKTPASGYGLRAFYP